MVKINLISVVFALLVLILSPQITDADISLWFEPNPMNVSVGNAFTIGLYGSAGENDYFNDWGLKLDYDHNLLSFDSAVSDSDFHLILGLQKNGDTISGQLMLPDVFPTDGLFAALTFSCLGSGTSIIGFSSGQSYGFAFNLYSYITGEILSTDFRTWSYTPGTVNQSVPEPATMLLLGSSLLGLIGFRRKLRK